MKHSFSIPVLVLLDVLVRLAPLIPKKSTMAILRCVLLRRGSAYATNLDVALTLTVPSLMPVAPLCAELAPLLNAARTVLKAAGGKKVNPLVTLTVDELTLTVDGGGMSLIVPLHKPDDYPPLPLTCGAHDPTTAPSAMIGPLTLQAMREASACASTDVSRYILNGVYLDFGENEMRVVATDGRRLYRSRSFYLPRIHSVILPLMVLRFLGESPWRMSTILSEEVKDQPNADRWVRYVCFTSPAATLFSKVVEGYFPNYRQVIPQFKPDDCNILPLYPQLLPLLDSIPKDAKNGNVRIDILHAGSTITAAESLAKQPIIPLALKTEKIIGFSGAYLRAAISMGFSRYYISQDKRDHSPGLAYDGAPSESARCMVIMPVSLNVDQPGDAEARAAKEAEEKADQEEALHNNQPVAA